MTKVKNFSLIKKYLELYINGVFAGIFQSITRLFF
jgi:hypothetical protein